MSIKVDSLFALQGAEACQESTRGASIQKQIQQRLAARVHGVAVEVGHAGQ
jgi:hypothetical protein